MLADEPKLNMKQINWYSIPAAIAKRNFPLAYVIFVVLLAKLKAERLSSLVLSPLLAFNKIVSKREHPQINIAVESNEAFFVNIIPTK